mmetsp:Transcript_110416/g.323004  ORF Transcript_110416/g.323004 Transcript_110416/m.323004 type:complete len:207 (+) Transcript_110416:260-880(+)
MSSAMTERRVMDLRNSCSCLLRRPPRMGSESVRDSSSPDVGPAKLFANPSSISSRSEPRPSSSTFSLRMGAKTATHSENGMSLRICLFFLSGWTGRLGCSRWQKLQPRPLAHSPFAKYRQGRAHSSGCPKLPSFTSLTNNEGFSGLPDKSKSVLSTFARSSVSATTWFATPGNSLSSFFTTASKWSMVPATAFLAPRAISVESTGT